MADKKRKGSRGASKAPATALAPEKSEAEASPSDAGDNGSEPAAAFDLPDKKQSQPSESAPSAESSSNTASAAASVSTAQAGESNLKQQRTSLILRAVLEDEPPPAESQSNRKLRYPWYADMALAVGLLVAVAGFTIGLFKMYITHKAQQCIMETDYAAAIALLKGNPLPPIFSINGNDRNEDPDELLARALYLDAMHKIDDENDMKGGIDELAQIRAGTHYFDEAQKILSDHFQPSSTRLTGGVVENETKPSR